jgi:hypothetical protein
MDSKSAPRALRRTVAFALGVFLIAGLVGCTLVRGSGDVISEERDVSGFDSILVQGGGILEIVQTDDEGLTITADENLLEYIETDVKGDTLEITIRDPNTQIMPSEDIRYEVRLRDLNEVDVDGSVDIVCEGMLTDDVKLDISGSSSVAFSSLDADSLELSISGSADSTIDGEIAEQRLDISGSGDFQHGELRSRSSRVSISGSGDVTVWATDELDIDVSGSGNVSYYGSPTVSQNLSGSADIESLGDK